MAVLFRLDIFKFWVLLGVKTKECLFSLLKIGVYFLKCLCSNVEVLKEGEELIASINIMFLVSHHLNWIRTSMITTLSVSRKRLDGREQIVWLAEWTKLQERRRNGLHCHVSKKYWLSYSIYYSMFDSKSTFIWYDQLRMLSHSSSD